MSPTLEHLADGLVTQEVAIPQQEHIFLEEPQQGKAEGDIVKAFLAKWAVCLCLPIPPTL